MIDPSQLPHSLETERAVIGCLITKPALFGKVDGSISTSDFYHRGHRTIFSALKAICDANEPVDLVTLTAALESSKELDKVGGVVYLTELASSVPTTEHLDHYLQILLKYSKARALIKLSQDTCQKVLSGEDVSDLIDETETKIRTLGNREKKGFKPLASILTEAYNVIDERHRLQGELSGIPSGYDQLDNMIGGFQDEDLIVVAARPSVGKTAWALNVARHAAKRTGKPVGMISLEMNATSLVERMLAAEANIELEKIKRGCLTAEDWPKLINAIGILSKLPIYIDDASTNTLADIKAKCRRLQQENGLGMILIDYLQKMQLSKNGPAAHREQEVSELSSGLKTTARELKVPVIALAQLSRSVEQRQNKRPMMSDIRESGAIEQDADIIGFLYRDDYYDKETDNRNVVEVIIAKHRNGPTGTVELGFIREYSKFVNLDYQMRLG